MEISKFLVLESDTVKDAIRAIEDAGSQIALVVDKERHLLGTVTDGDIRRGMLGGSSIEENVKSVMNSNYKYVTLNDSKEVALSFMRENSINLIPIIDQNKKLLDLFTLKTILHEKELPNAVVIMAGGKGKRLLPYTQNCPKPMLLVGGKPILEIILERCIEAGFKEFYFSVNYLKDMIIKYFQDGNKWGVKINYLIEERALGTAGSLKLLPKNLKFPFLVINGDILTDLDLRQLVTFHNKHKSEGTICVREHREAIPFGVVLTEGMKLLEIEEKPIYSFMVNAGIYIIDPKLIELTNEDGPTDMPTLLTSASSSGYIVNACPIHEYWIDIGRPSTLKQASNEISQAKNI